MLKGYTPRPAKPSQSRNLPLHNFLSAAETLPKKQPFSTSNAERDAEMVRAGHRLMTRGKDRKSSADEYIGDKWLSDVYRSSAHSFSLRICSSSSGVKSLVMLKVLRISSGDLPLIMLATVLHPTSSSALMSM